MAHVQIITDHSLGTCPSGRAIRVQYKKVRFRFNVELRSKCVMKITEISQKTSFSNVYLAFIGTKMVMFSSMSLFCIAPSNNDGSLVIPVVDFY